MVGFATAVQNSANTTGQDHAHIQNSSWHFSTATSNYVTLDKQIPFLHWLGMRTAIHSQHRCGQPRRPPPEPAHTRHTSTQVHLTQRQAADARAKKGVHQSGFLPMHKHHVAVFKTVVCVSGRRMFHFLRSLRQHIFTLTPHFVVSFNHMPLTITVNLHHI